MYKILEHSADEKFRAQADTLEQAFKETVKAFSEVIGGESGESRHTIKVKSENLEALLYDFLDEIIFLQDSENVVVSYASKLELKDLKQEGWEIEAEIMVDPITYGNKPLHVKSPTYNEMRVDYEKGKGWIIEAVLDV